MYKNVYKMNVLTMLIKIGLFVALKVAQLLLHFILVLYYLFWRRIHIDKLFISPKSYLVTLKLNRPTSCFIHTFLGLFISF